MTWNYEAAVTTVSFVITRETRDNEINNEWITKRDTSSRRSFAFDVRTCEETTHCCIQFLPQQFSLQLSFEHEFSNSVKIFVNQSYLRAVFHFKELSNLAPVQVRICDRFLIIISHVASVISSLHLLREGFTIGKRRNFEWEARATRNERIHFVFLYSLWIHFTSSEQQKKTLFSGRA